MKEREGGRDKMIPFPKKKYKVIYADPPWNIDILRTGKDKGRRFDNYETMKTDDICSLPIHKIRDDEAVLFLWATNTFLPDALRVMSEWGFKYHCTITWDKKQGITMKGFHRVTEFLLFGYSGKFPSIDRGKPIKTLVSKMRLKHSQKPEVFRKIISDKMGFGDCIELFARNRCDGWDAWGDEVPNEIQKNLGVVGTK